MKVRKSRQLAWCNGAVLARSATRLLGDFALGLFAGVSSAAVSYAFLKVLFFVTETRLDHEWLVWLLPLGGLAIGVFVHIFGNGSHRGSQLVFDEIVDPGERMPRRLAPVVILASWATHLFGGSAGREGVAVQASAGTVNAAARTMGMTAISRRVVLVAAVSGAFSAVFAVPYGGWLIGIEIAAVAGIRLRCVLPACVAAFSSNALMHWWHVSDSARPTIEPHLSLALVGDLLLFGIVAGIVTRLFVSLMRGWASFLERITRWAPARPVIGGLAVLFLMEIAGRDYLGLSLPLGESALAGAAVLGGAFALKLLFTAITLGAGFPGGEVTPLAVSGALLGCSYGNLTGADPKLFAAVGFFALYAAAVGAPWACSVMAAEIFGTRMFPLVLPVVLLATVFTREHRLHHPGEFRPDQERAARE